ncbi:helix-turn-helix domain-containing protein [Mucilaginibacter sp. UR6-1]|uniref:helix-turn-helix domain-containing protein n=1 Tax=Mucilaginibacter sp. UR6-1 TaxID=1435643 RepID=UPI001E2CE4E7|nr:helix-turn-helix domain-containing protein [Mucilaginibacter sp. UR6-1]
MINIKNDEVIKAFGRKLRDLRTSQKLSQEQLANIAEIPLSQVGRIERGEINPTLSTINALATALKIEIKNFFN